MKANRISGGGRASDTVTDGTAKFIVRDVRCKYRTGEIVALYGEPKAWDYLLLCDGSTVSADDYPELCGVLGGNVLPNLVGRVLQGGSVSGEYKSAGLPNITGTGPLMRKGTESGCFTTEGLPMQHFAQVDSWHIAFLGGPGIPTPPTLDASRCSAIYGNSSTVQPPAMTIKYYICYA